MTATKGHIQLSTNGVTYQDYLLVDPLRWNSQSANPFAGKVSTGGPYAQLNTFSDWTIKDWHTGVGHRNPDDGPLFSVADTRFPNQLFMPLGFELPFVNWSSGGGDDYDQYHSPITAYNDKLYSTSFISKSTYATTTLWVYIKCPATKTVTVRLHTDNAGKPGTVQRTATTTSAQTRPHAHWMKFTFTSYTLALDTKYHVSVGTNQTPTSYTAEMPAIVPAGGNVGHYSTDGGTTWLENTQYYGEANTPYNQGFQFIVSSPVDTMTTTIHKFVQLGSDLYVQHPTGVTQLVTMPAVYSRSGVVDMCVVDGKILVAYGTGYASWAAPTATSTDYSTLPADLLLLHAGYLWRAHSDTVSYTSDGTTWVDVKVANYGYKIRGMAGIGNDMYVSCDDGLYSIVGGDQVVPVLPWPTVSSTNGVGMVSWEGALYIPLQEDIFRYDTAGALLNIGLRAGEGVPTDVQGTVSCLYPTQYFLLASVKATDANGYGSLWAYNVDGWHCLALGLQGATPGGIHVDRTNNTLWWAADCGLFLRTNYPASVVNPARDTSTKRYAAEGWVEYDYFVGGYGLLDKDIHSIDADYDASAYSYAELWYKLDTASDWTRLIQLTGATGATFSLTARPTGKKIRLGFRLKTVKRYSTPIVRAYNFKYHTMLTDRWRWVLPIIVSDNQEMLDGTLNTSTYAQQIANLEELRNTITPVMFKDVDGTTYTVKITDISRNLARYDYKAVGGVPDPQMVYTLQLEEL